MRGNLRARLARLIERDPSTVGRMIVVKIDAERVDDSDLVQATLAGAGIERVEKDLMILIKRYGTGEPEPPCSLVSVSPLTPKARSALR